MTDAEVRDWALAEFARAETIENKQEANQIRYRAKIILDKRFPNPDVCPCCKQKVK
ncbi:MAG: hypothetical protein JSW07_00320 [bacterium]|nr:MAG: hypothetical protein JSW07_00320 [bacterium]